MILFQRKHVIADTVSDPGLSTLFGVGVGGR